MMEKAKQKKIRDENMEKKYMNHRQKQIKIEKCKEKYGNLLYIE